MSFKEELSALIGEESLVPSSFEIFDQIAVINLKESQMKFKQQIGESLMRNNKQLKCVYVKSDRLENQFRTPELDFVTGEKMTLVRHKENGA